ncbi:hypothetical protein DFH06DRAFT_1292117 [Mycena polygramma]|nr:hypothetical protein DFH06DRAFT_1292117 [Mycena polygramma]
MSFPDMNYVVASVEFEALWCSMLFDVALISGLYAVLFLFSIRTLQGQLPGGNILRLTTWVMFILATGTTLLACVATGVSTRAVYVLVHGSVDDSVRLARIYKALILAEDIILAYNNLVTDLLFLYRCYVIWGSRKRIILLPGVLILATVVVGCLTGLEFSRLIKINSFFGPKLPFVIAGITNLVLTCLTAGRIWYIRREVQIIGGWRGFRKRYATASAIILESGILYSVFVIIYIVSSSINTDNSSQSGTVFQGVAWAVVQLGVNLVPTLILVRVGLGRSTENTAGPVLLSHNSKV